VLEFILVQLGILHYASLCLLGCMGAITHYGSHLPTFYSVQGLCIVRVCAMRVLFRYLQTPGSGSSFKETRASNFVLLDLFGPAIQPQKNFRLPVLGVNAMRRLVRIRPYTSNSFHRKQKPLLNY
jgi:hypothetical protein